MLHFTALVTCLAILLYFFTCIRVARARAAFGIKAPAIIGNPDFERVFRVQMNTLEWLPIFLPSLWLFAIYVSDPIAAVHWPRLDRRPRPLHDRLLESRRKARGRFSHSGAGCGHSLAGRAGRDCRAPRSCLRADRVLRQCGICLLRQRLTRHGNIGDVI